jgi:hypothetical protein
VCAHIYITQFQKDLKDTSSPVNGEAGVGTGQRARLFFAGRCILHMRVTSHRLNSRKELAKVMRCFPQLGCCYLTEYEVLVEGQEVTEDNSQRR